MSSDADARPSAGAPDPAALAHESPEALAALVERCFLRAGESLSGLLGREIRLRTSRVAAMALDALPALTGTGGPLGGLQFRIEGEAGGCIIVLFPLPAIHRMLEAIAGGAPAHGSFTDLERSAICEVGNVLASSFLTELGEQTGRRLAPSTPRLVLDDLEGLMAETRVALQPQGPEVVVTQGLFQDPGREIEGRFFILPEVGPAWTRRRR
jgi:chemotaxis protein CheC